MNHLFNQLIKQKQNKILCLAKNYLKHAIEFGAKDVPTYPLFFTKPWSSLVYEPNPIKINSKLNHSIDHEVELGVVIGKAGKRIKKEDYLNYIQAYFVGLDITDRTWQTELRQNVSPWFISKGQDYFLPISKFISSGSVRDPHNLELAFYINEQVKQKENTGKMHFKIGETIEYISKFLALYPGDLILTGTPHGIGPIRVGDKLRATAKQEGNVLVEMKFNVEEDDGKIKH